MKVNDRAPARHADMESEVGLQQTHIISLGDYIQYVEVRHRPPDSPMGTSKYTKTQALTYSGNLGSVTACGAEFAIHSGEA